MLIVLALTYVGGVLLLVNIVVQQHNPALVRRVQALLFVSVGFIAFISLNMFLGGITSSPVQARMMPFPSIISGLVGLILAGFSAGIIIFRPLRVWIRTHLPENATYNADRISHTTALVLMISLLVYLLSIFISVGGQQGLAEALEESAPSISGLVADASVYVFVAFLGVGFFIRRTPRATLKRLGLRFPTRDDIRAGILSGVGLFVVMNLLSSLWMWLVTPEQLAEQTAAAEQIVRAYGGTLVGGFVLALLSGVGEEILFRGAAQPVFGIWVASIYFAIVHLQYAFTPASVIILLVSFGFGWIRYKYSTTAAIISHVLYNLLPFLFIYLLSGVPPSGA